MSSVNDFAQPLVEQSGVTFDAYHTVHAGPLHGVSLPRALLSGLAAMLGTLESFALLLRRKPAALLLTGGWVGLPVALAAWVLRIPSLIILPDVEPGLSIRVLSRFARKITVSVAGSSAYVPAEKMVVTGYPLRQQVLTATREAGLAHFKLDPTRKTVLIFGGSRGAQSINTALGEIAPTLLAEGAQLIHISGTLDWPQVEARRAALPEDLQARYHAFPYLHTDMGLALAAADLVISRAGATVMGEFPYFGLPSVLIPYPYAWRYQKVNADFLVEHGAAVLVTDTRMKDDLLNEVRGLLNDSARLEAMRASAARLAEPDSAWRVGQELLRLAGADL